MDNIVALKYLVKMGGTHNQDLVESSKQITKYLLDQEITITAEYLPGKLNVEADRESREVQDSSEWKLDPQIFSRLTAMLGSPEIDLFASRLSHQIPCYMSWKLDPFSMGRDAFQIKWDRGLVYAFPPFSLIARVLKKVQKDLSCMMIITPLWQTQMWYPTILRMSVRNPILLPNVKNLLKSPLGNNHPLI